MVYKFKVLSDEDSKFYMDIEILSEQTLYDLHDLIQDELEFDRSHLASFYTASHSWKRIKEIPLIVMDNSAMDDVVTMEKAVLSEYVKDAHQKFIYVFDYVNDRGFKIELEETKPESPNMYYPVCTDFKGEIPPQIGKKTTKKSSIFDDDDDDKFDLPHKPLPILDDDLDDIPDVPIDKDIASTFEIDIDEEELDEEVKEEEPYEDDEDLDFEENVDGDDDDDDDDI